MLCFQHKALTSPDVDIPFTTLTLKIKSLYVAYAPEFDVSAYGGCRARPGNNLLERIAHKRISPP